MQYNPMAGDFASRSMAGAPIEIDQIRNLSRDDQIQFYNQSNPMAGSQQQVIPCDLYGISYDNEEEHRTFYVIKGEGVEPTPEEKQRHFQTTGLLCTWGVRLRWATEFKSIRHDIQTSYEPNMTIRGPVIDGENGQQYVYTPAGYLPVLDEADDDKDKKLKPLLFEDQEDNKERLEERRVDEAEEMDVEWAQKRADHKRLTDVRGNHFSYCSLTEEKIGDTTGAGLQIYFGTLKWYGALFFIVTLLAIHPLALNAGGYQEDSWQNSTGFTRVSLGNMALDPSNDSNVGAEAAWDVITIIAAFLFLAIFNRRNEVIASQQDASNCTAADYAIMLKNLPPQTTKYDIMDYFSKAEFLQYFANSKVDLVRASDRPPGPLVKDNCFTCVDVHDLTLHLPYYKKSKKRLRSLELSIERDRRKLVLDNGMDQAQSDALSKKVEQNEAKVQKNEEKHNKARDKYEELLQIKLKKQGLDECQHAKDRCRCGEMECLQQLQTDCSGYAFAVLKDPQMATAILEWFQSREQWWMPSQWCCGSSATPPMLYVAALKKQVAVKIERAPEPAEIYWENFALTSGKRLLIRIMTTLLTLVVCLVTGLVVWFLEGWARDGRECPVSNTSCPNYSCGDKTQLRGRTIIIALVTILLNSGIRFFVTYINGLEQPKNRTESETNLLLKLSIAYVLNTVIIHFVVITSYDQWYISGGLAELATLISLSNSIVPSLVAVVRADERLEQWWNARKATTQSELKSAYAPYHFDLSEAYASVVKTVAIALLFGQMSPLVYPISAITMGILYATWKYKLVYQSRQPPLFSSALRNQFRKIVLLLVMAHIVVGCFVFKQNSCAAKFKVECSAGGSTSDCGNTGGAVAVGLIGSLTLLLYLFLPMSCYKNCFELCIGKEQEWQDGGEDNNGILDAYGNSRLFPGSVTGSRIEVKIKEKQHGQGSWTYKIPDPQEWKDILVSPRSQRAYMPAAPTPMPPAPQQTMPAAPQQAGGSSMPPPPTTASTAPGGQPAHVQAAIYTPTPIAPQPTPAPQVAYTQPAVGPSASFQPPPPPPQGATFMPPPPGGR